MTFARITTDSDVRVPRDQALRYLGYRGQDIDAQLDARLTAILDRCEMDSSASFTWRPFSIKQTLDERILLADTIVELSGKSIVWHLRDSDCVVLLACTLGMVNERTLQQLSLTGPSDALLYDACSSALVEACADAASSDVEDWAQSVGSSSTKRFSPGYGDLPLALQKDILAALDATKSIGLSTTRESLLVPTKSITAIIGIRRKIHD